MSAYQVQADPTDVGGKRVVAAIIDWGIWVVINSVLFFALAESASTGGFFNCADTDATANQCVLLGDKIYVVEDSNAMLLNIIQIGYMIGIFVLMRGLTGKTPGTLLMGIRCVDEQGQPIGIGKGFVRSIVGIVDYIPCCLPLVGLITMFTTKGHRRVGDMAAKTYMVDGSHQGPVIVPGVTTPAAAPYGASAAAPYGAPGAAPYATPGAMGAQAASPGGPAGDAQWDAQRNAWIRWEAAQESWLEWDEQTQQWTPIS